MKHLGTKTLETERLLLRRFTLADAEAMFENWASGPEVTRYLTWPPHDSAAVTEAVLRDWTSQYPRTDYYQWAIVLRENGPAPIGSIGVVAQEDAIGMAQIGYCIGRSWWRRGITAEALRRVIAFLLEEVGMRRVEARHDPSNPASGAVMQKCGMQYEGTLRQADRNNEGICDACYYAILSADR